MNMRLPKYLRDRDPQQMNGLPHLEVLPAETAEIVEAEWMAAALDAFEQQVEQVLMEEAWIETCIEQMIAEENYHPVWEISQNSNITFVHSMVVMQQDASETEPVPQLPLFAQSYSSDLISEQRQSMISHSKLNPEAPEFIPRGMASP